MNILAWLGQRATGALAAGAILGLILPGPADLFLKLLPLLVFAFTVVSFLKVETAEIVRAWRRPLLPLLLSLWCLVVSPIILALVIRLLSVPEGLAQAIVLWAASPPMIAAAVFAVLLRLDGALAMGVTIVCMLIMPMTAPPLSLLLTGLSVNIDVMTLTMRVGAFMISAAIVAWAAQRLVGRSRLMRRTNELSGVSVLVLVAYGASLMPVVREEIAVDPARVLLFVAVAFVTNLAFQTVTGLLFFRFGRLHCATAGLLAGNRNMSVICANLGVAATSEVMLFFAAIHLPIYTLPWVLRRLYFLVSRDSVMTAAPGRGFRRKVAHSDST